MQTAVRYDVIGQGYNVTRQADPYIAERLFRLLGPHRGHRYLDIGCGTGNYTAALWAKNTDITGVDPSAQMLETARHNHSAMQWVQGTAEQIPFADNTFAGVVGTLTIHHWTNLTLAFRELHRVTTPGARIVLFTSTPTQMEGYWLNHYFPLMMQDSIRQMPELEAIEAAASEAGLLLTGTELYTVQDGLEDYFLYAGKNKPELYFNPLIRRGISSFSSLANAAEIQHGLAALRMDLEMDAFRLVRKRYLHMLGDYLFVILERPVV